MSLTRVATSMIALTALVSGGSTRTLEEKLRDIVSVKDFSCSDGSKVLGNGTHDDTTGIQAALTWGATHGAEVYFPAGTYRVTAQLTIDESATTTEDATRLSVYGAGPGCTLIASEVASGPIFYFLGSESASSGGVHAFQRIAGLRITGTGYNGIAISGENLPYFAVENVVIQYCADAFVFQDVLSSYFANVIVRGCLRGFTAQRHSTSADDYESDPNNITFIGSTFSSLPQYGIYLIGGSNFNFYGGSLENIGLSYQWPATGHGARPTSRWCAKFDKMGREGAVGCNFQGTYIEANDVVADIWIDQPANPADTGSPGLDDADDPTGIRFTSGVAYNFNGVNFHRTFNSDPVVIQVAGVDVSYPRSPTVNNIRLDTPSSKPAALSITGCGFRSAGTYVADVSRQCIQLPPTASGWRASQHGNIFSHDVDAPLWQDTPSFTAFLTGDQGIPNDSATLLNFQRVEDYGNCFDTASHAWIAPHRCRMHFNVQVHFPSLPDNSYVALEVYVNGSLTRASSQTVKSGQTFGVSFDLNVSKNDAVTVKVLQNSGGERTVYSGLSSTFFEGHPA